MSQPLNDEWKSTSLFGWIWAKIKEWEGYCEKHREWPNRFFGCWSCLEEHIKEAAIKEAHRKREYEINIVKEGIIRAHAEMGR